MGITVLSLFDGMSVGQIALKELGIKVDKVQKSVIGSAKEGIKSAKGSSQAGLCSEERSMISPDYARNWICDFILGKVQKDKAPGFGITLKHV